MVMLNVLICGIAAYCWIVAIRLVRSDDFRNQKGAVILAAVITMAVLFVIIELGHSNASIYLNKVLSVIFQHITFGLIGDLVILFLVAVVIILFVQYIFSIFKIGTKYKELHKEYEVKKRKLASFYKEQEKLTQGELKKETQDKNNAEAVATEIVREKNVLPWTLVYLKRPYAWNKLSVMKSLAKDMSFNEALYWHSNEEHVVFMKLSAKDIARFAGQENRNDSDRHKLHPLIYPVGQEYDRTHLIPISIIGTELDERVVVGFESKLNRNILRKWEAAAKDYITQIGGGFWFVSLSKTKDNHIIWKYRLFSIDMKLVNQIAVESRLDYVWK